MGKKKPSSREITERVVFLVYTSPITYRNPELLAVFDDVIKAQAYFATLPGKQDGRLTDPPRVAHKEDWDMRSIWYVEKWTIS